MKKRIYTHGDDDAKETDEALLRGAKEEDVQNYFLTDKLD